MRTRSLGLGNITLIDGNDMYGYYGKYTGIATPNEIITLADITEGTTKDDDYNDPDEPITWLKFSHNYKTLFVADRTIHYAVSWNHLEEKGVVFGKVVEIDGQKYMLRLLQGANVNPASSSGGSESNDEWDSLIVEFTPDTEDSHWDRENDPVNDASEWWTGGAETIIQETGSNNIDNACARGGSNLTSFVSFSKNQNNAQKGYRPVLEVL